jgi:hypothetical protein
MFTKPKSSSALAASIGLAFALATNNASAITVEVAKKCDVLVAKAFPPRETGNPAAGSAKGNAQSQRDYFSKCVTNGGKMDDDDAHKDSK